MCTHPTRTRYVVCEKIKFLMLLSVSTFDEMSFWRRCPPFFCLTDFYSRQQNARQFGVVGCPKFGGSCKKEAARCNGKLAGISRAASFIWCVLYVLDINCVLGGKIILNTDIIFLIYDLTAKLIVHIILENIQSKFWHFIFSLLVGIYFHLYM